MGGSKAPMPYQPAHSPQVDNALYQNLTMNNAHTGELYDYASPQYRGLYDRASNNPGDATATATGWDVAGKGAAAGNNMLARGYEMAGLAPGVIQSAWDPQSANFNWDMGQVRGAADVGAAESGLAGSPFGAGVTNDALATFMRGWGADAQARQGVGIEQLAKINDNAGATMGQGLQTITDSGLMPQAVFNDQTTNRTAALDALVRGLTGITSSSQANAAGMTDYINAGTNAANAGANVAKANNATTEAMWGAIGQAAGLAASFIPK